MRRIVDRVLKMLRVRGDEEPTLEYGGTSPGKADRRNAPGDFYVLDRCCSECGVPTEIAPALFSFDESSEPSGGCWVSRQPIGTTEVQTMLDVIRTQEMGCIRYRGDDAAIVKKLDEVGEGNQCDANHA